MKNFTFKTEKSTVRYASFYPDIYNIKYNGIEVGTIESEKPYTIKLQVLKTETDFKKVSNNHNCDWKWIRLKKEFQSVVEAKQWLKDNVKMILESIKLIES